MAHDVFISYPHQDKVTADAACAKLEAEGIRCWIAPRDVAHGAEWAEAIVDAIDQCRVMVLIFSSYANQSKQVRREVQQAFDGEKPVVPFRIENVNPEKSLRYYMGSVHWLDALSPPLDQHLQKLTASVRALVGASDEVKWRAEGRIKIDAKIINGAPDGWFKPGAGEFEWFQDREDGPEMVVVPSGEFVMGSPEDETDRFDAESPQTRVTFMHPFSVGRHAVTRGQFATFVGETGYKAMEAGATIWIGSEWKHDPNESWRSPGFRQDDNHPVVCVGWNDARAYVSWLSHSTGQSYRLLSEAEWEYVARSGATTPFWWGSSITSLQANYDSNYVYNVGGSKAERRKTTVPVGNFQANRWGLYNVHGNVWEWCEDIWHGSYGDLPADGSAWVQGGNSHYRIIRGGSWNNRPGSSRSANRNRAPPGSRADNLGFRVGRALIS